MYTYTCHSIVSRPQPQGSLAPKDPTTLETLRSRQLLAGLSSGPLLRSLISVISLGILFYVYYDIGTNKNDMFSRGLRR